MYTLLKRSEGTGNRWMIAIGMLQLSTLVAATCLCFHSLKLTVPCFCFILWLNLKDHDKKHAYFRLHVSGFLFQFGRETAHWFTLNTKGKAVGLDDIIYTVRQYDCQRSFQTVYNMVALTLVCLGLWGNAENQRAGLLCGKIIVSSVWWNVLVCVVLNYFIDKSSSFDFP